MLLAEILDESLMDGIKARDTYRSIIVTYGPIRAFMKNVARDQNHINMLPPPYERYGIAVPKAPNPASIPVPASLLEARQAAVRAEIDNATRYDRLLGETGLSGVRALLARLQAASGDHNLPAFQRCAEHGSTGETRPGLGGGRGAGSSRGYGGGRGRRFGAARSGPR